MDLREGIISEWAGIPFSNKEELISLIMDACSCQRDMALKVIDKILLESFNEGYISKEFFQEYWSGDEMGKYYYCVNTFKNDEPVQLEGYVDAETELDAVRKLIKYGDVDPYGYEFLRLEEIGGRTYE